MKAESDPNLKQWLKRKMNVYTSPDIQNEVIKLFGMTVLRVLVSEIHCSPFITIMVDETTDVRFPSSLSPLKASPCMQRYFMNDMISNKGSLFFIF